MSDQPTLRDQFAMHAIASILTTQKLSLREYKDAQQSAIRAIAETAYQLADVMLEVRAEKSTPLPADLRAFPTTQGPFAPPTPPVPDPEDAKGSGGLKFP